MGPPKMWGPGQLPGLPPLKPALYVYGIYSICIPNIIYIEEQKP